MFYFTLDQIKQIQMIKSADSFLLFFLFLSPTLSSHCGGFSGFQTPINLFFLVVQYCRGSKLPRFHNFNKFKLTLNRFNQAQTLLDLAEMKSADTFLLLFFFLSPTLSSRCGGCSGFQTPINYLIQQQSSTVRGLNQLNFTILISLN